MRINLNYEVYSLKNEKQVKQRDEKMNKRKGRRERHKLEFDEVIYAM